MALQVVPAGDELGLKSECPTPNQPRWPQGCGPCRTCLELQLAVPGDLGELEGPGGTWRDLVDLGDASPSAESDGDQGTRGVQRGFVSPWVREVVHLPTLAATGLCWKIFLFWMLLMG